MENKKFGRWGELAWVLGTILLSLGTVLQAKASLGLGSTVAPAYVLSEAVGFIPPGTMCYICQGGLVLVTFILLRRFKLEFIVTFVSAVIFGQFVNLFTKICFANLTDPTILQRCLIFAMGSVVVAVSIAFLLNSYFPPQAPEMFTKEVSQLIGWSKYKGKYVYDICSFSLAVVLSFIFFREIRIIGIGTFVSAAINGPMITFFGRLMERYLDFSPVFPKLAGLFGVKK